MSARTIKHIVQNLPLAYLILPAQGFLSVGPAWKVQHVPLMVNEWSNYCIGRNSAYPSFSTTSRYVSSTLSTEIQTSNSTTSIWDEEEMEDNSGEWIHEEEHEESNDEYSFLLREYEAWSNAVKHVYKKLEKKHKSLQAESTKAQNVEKTMERAQLLVSNLYLFPKGTLSAMVPDWENDGVEVEVTLDPQFESASAEAEALFAQARKLKRGSQVLAPLLEETSQLLATLDDTRVDLESAKLSDTEIDQGRLALVKERLTRTSRQTGLQIPDLSNDDPDDMSKSKGRRPNTGNTKHELGTPGSNIRKLKSPGGCTVLVGRNRRGNEYLSLTLARQNDVWMHSRGCPGAHVVIHNRRGGPTPTEEDLQFAADLAIFYSDLRTEARAPVSAAEPKHLQKPRGAPLGAIKVREEWRTFMGRPDQVPDELKVARDKSGQSDEYRQEDKAKHRRRTRQAAEEEKARRRRKKKN